MSHNGRNITADEAALWQSVAKTVTPLAQRHHGRTTNGAKPQPSQRQTPVTSVPKLPHEQNARPQPLTNFQHRELRRLASGRMAIEARLDLHGMYQSEAHKVLRNFVYRCRSNGFRHVLVITGKGRREGPEAGILRRAVPLWLESPGFREHVVSCSTSHSRHGGEGALYVRLRRK